MDIIELFRLFGTVMIDNKDAIAKLKSLDKPAISATQKLNNIADKGIKIGTAIIGGTTLAVGGLLKLAKSTSDTASKWLELSQRTDIGIVSLQKWGYVANQTGVDINKLVMGTKTLSQATVDATKNTGKARDAFTKLGLKYQDLKKMKPEKVFDAVILKLAEMPESAEKNVIGNQLLGRSYTELKPLLAEGADGIEELRKRAEELGIVMSEDGIMAAEAYGDTLDTLKLSIEGNKNQLMLEFLPALQKVLDWIIAHMPEIKEFTKNAFDKIAEAIDWVKRNSEWLIPVLGTVYASFIALKVLQSITPLIWLFNAALSANPIVLVIAAIALLILSLISLGKRWDKVKDSIEKALNMLKYWNKTSNATGAGGMTTGAGGGGSGGGKIGGRAKGTSNASPGWSWVGEEGPELMKLRGGETILSNKNSISALNNSGVTITGNVFNVRNDDDIKRIAKEVSKEQYKMQLKGARA